MRMASMVQIYPPHEHREQYNYEGYGSSAALISSQFAFNGAPPATLLPCSDHKLNDSMWEANKSSPQMEGPFTPVPLSSSACTHQDDHSSYMEAITRSVNSDILSFNNIASFDMDFPLAEENQLIELMGLQRKLSMYSSYGDDDHDLSQESMAAADDENDSFLKACSYGDEAKMGNLARSFTFPPAGARSVSSSCAARSPLIRSSDTDIRNPNPNNLDKHFNHQLLYRENSSAATTSCSNGDECEAKGKDVKLKIEGVEVSNGMLGDREQQGGMNEQIGGGNKQCRKRSASMGNSNNMSAKAARLDSTPPDVVHVRARRGQATDSHSLAERVRREKISQRMKVLQEIVPGCHKVLGKAMMLDEIINYVKSLQKQVEFLSMKLAAANQVGMASMIANEVKFLLPNMEFFGDFNSSCQVIKSEPLMHSLIQ